MSMPRTTLRHISLKTRVALAMAAVFVTVVGTLAVLGLRYFETEFRNSLYTQQYALVSSLATSIDEKIRITQDALNLSSRHLSREALSDPELAQRSLDRMAALHSLFDNGLFLISPEGKVIAESPYKPDQRGRDMTNRKFFQVAAATLKPHISVPYLSSDAPGQPALMMTSPLLGERGELIGILQGSFDLLGRNFLANLRQTKIGHSGYVFITDLNRTMIMHPDAIRLMSEAARPGKNELYDQALTGFEGSGPTVTSHGQAMFSSFKRLSTTGWILAANYPITEAEAPLRQAQRYFLLALGLGTGIVLLVAWLIMHRLLAPLATLTRHVQELPNKTGTNRLLPVTSGGEIGTLMQASNAMVNALDAQQQTLRDSEARFRSLTALSTDWYWEQDAEFRFTQMSIERIRADIEPFIGKTRWELPLEGVTPGQWAEHRRLLEQHQPFRDFVYQVRADNGELHTFSISGTPFFDEQGVFRGYRGVGSDITARMTAEQRIEFLAYHDTLTGLPNRLLLQDRFEQAIAQAQRSNTRVALLFLDLDSFKSINDTLGHHCGDALLKAVAERLKECVRDTDTISRQGGDEFLIVLRDLPDTDVAAEVMIKIMDCLQAPLVTHGNEITTTVSMGATVFPEDGTDFETLLKKADLAMYRAKEAGRNTYRFFDEAMNAESVDHLQLLGGLRRALERHEFMLHYQPQIDLASGKVIGVEALLRWQHPELGLIEPQRFIPVAEESGLIVPIGQWVLFEACRQAMAWQQAGLPPLTMAVNFSGVQFKRGDVEQSVRRALQESGLAPALLELELTESILIQNVDGVLASLQNLKQLGVQLSIDDFGTGYSSLAYLKRFDIDRLKIDRTFVRDLATDPDDAAIVRAIIQMAHSLSLRTIAEGVETEDMLTQLRTFGCDEVQGFLFARPMPAADMAHYLTTSVASA
ncbi:MAG: EAL domain-containing protein [Hylemonella sp.]|nr:EAL domain-containing protein [Hylemonella sp.]MDP1936797.1 EAL domain-containing protein [Hylemonella sp.]